MYWSVHILCFLCYLIVPYIPVKSGSSLNSKREVTPDTNREVTTNSKGETTLKRPSSISNTSEQVNSEDEMFAETFHSENGIAGLDTKLDTLLSEEDKVESSARKRH